MKKSKENKMSWDKITVTLCGIEIKNIVPLDYSISKNKFAKDFMSEINAIEKTLPTK